MTGNTFKEIASQNKADEKFIKRPSYKLTAEILILGRIRMRMVEGLLTGHYILQKHIDSLGADKSFSRFFSEEEETAEHVVGATTAA